LKGKQNLDADMHILECSFGKGNKIWMQTFILGM